MAGWARRRRAQDGTGSRIRGRLLRGATAALIAIGVTVPGGARPAQAFDPSDIQKYIDLVNSAYTLIRNATGDEALKGAVQQIIAAIEAAKTQILSHMDALAAAEARACTRHHVIEFVDIERFTPQTLQTWAQDATGCATLVDSLASTVTDKAQVDVLGLAISAIGPIALAARARAGFDTVGLTVTLRHGNSAVKTQLAPRCRGFFDGEGNYDHTKCTAYNGDMGRDETRSRAEDIATVRTSRLVAKAALPHLQT